MSYLFHISVIILILLVDLIYFFSSQAYVDHRGTKKNWKVPPSSTIKQYMANILCEDRAEARAREEAGKGLEASNTVQ